MTKSQEAQIAVLKEKIKQLERDMRELENKAITVKTFQPYVRLFWVVVGAVVTGLIGIGFAILGGSA